MSNIEQIESNRQRLERVFTKLADDIGIINIGNCQQFPYGWRKAAKGRTVWRILEEAISQNMENRHHEFGISSMRPSVSEVSVYDAIIRFDNDNNDLFVNIKSAVLGGRTNKDDISKAEGLNLFFGENSNRQLFIVTFVIDFLESMAIKINKCYVMPIAWLPDIYVNPSNNGNLQSSKYKSLDTAIKRTFPEFYRLLLDEIEVARQKREAKRKKS